MNIFIGSFNNIEDVVKEFAGTSQQDLDGATVYLAWYGHGDWCGAAEVIYERDGRLYWVSGSHCSCTGLEESWSPVETDWATLKHVYDKGYQFDRSGEYDDFDK